MMLSTLKHAKLQEAQTTCIKNWEAKDHKPINCHHKYRFSSIHLHPERPSQPSHVEDAMSYASVARLEVIPGVPKHAFDACWGSLKN